MSSYRKDARWALSYAITDQLGLDSVNDLPYPVSSGLLVAIDATLDGVSEEKLKEIIARRDELDREAGRDA